MFTMKFFNPGLFIALMFFISCKGTPEPAGNESEPAMPTIDQVLERLTGEIANNPNSENLYIERANYYLAKDDIENALRDILFAIDINNNNPNHYITLSEAYLALGDPDRSYDGLEKALKLHPKNQEALLKKAQLYLIMRQYEKTHETIRELIAIDKFNPTAYYIRGYALLEEGDTMMAIRNFVTAVDQKQDYFDAYMQLGAIYSAMNHTLASEYLSNAIEIRPDSPEAYYQLGLFFQENDRINEAIDAYNNILAFEPDYVLAKYNLGYIHLVFLREFEAAAGYFAEVIRQMPDNYDAWYNRGYSYELLGETTKARNDYQKTLQIKTNYRRAIDGLNRLDQ
jgi:tetratricopeptide (TPR) repeat protein